MKKLLIAALLLLGVCFICASCSCDGEVTVMFDSHTDIEIPSQTVPVGEKVTMPDAELQRDGYAFVGWFNGDKAWDFDKDTVSEDTVISAKWESYLSYEMIGNIEAESVRDLFMAEEQDCLIVTGCAFDVENVVIPTEYNGKRVIGILRQAFADRKFLRTVYIPDTVVSVGEDAFYGCSVLETIVYGAPSIPSRFNEDFDVSLRVDGVEYRHRFFYEN